MSVLGRLFGTETAIKETINAARDGIDALIYTDEEKANDAAKDRSEARSMFVEWIRNSQGQNLARRLIALAITSVWLSQYFLGNLMLVVAVWVDDLTSDKLKESAKITLESAEGMNGAMMLILGFYFAAPHLGKLAEGALKKFGKAE